MEMLVFDRSFPMSISYAPTRPPQPSSNVVRHDIQDRDHDVPGNYSPYSNPDSPDEEDENASLRSQALNTDGTPKRPMNAFMIFARRRRPQVSAANQMMRTGEISKILSKEWNTMPMSDKQFYLDQAKKLKENFNSKYPDYVYRRRPNNSRKKRRSDIAPYDPMSPNDFDDFGGGNISPIDPHHPHHPHHGAGGMGAHHAYAHARGLSYGGSFGPSDPYYPSSRHHAASAYDAAPTMNGAAAAQYAHPTASLYHDDVSGSVWGGATAAAAAAAAAATAHTLPLPASKFIDHPQHPVHGHHNHHHSHAITNIPKLEHPFPQPPRLESLASTGGGPGGLLPPAGKLGPPAFTKSPLADAWGTHSHHQHHHQHPHPHDHLRLPARRGALHPAPLPLTHSHARHWSDGTTSASSVSPPSSAGSGGFPPSVTGAHNHTNGTSNSFATLTAAFAYPSAASTGGGSTGGSPAASHSSSAGSYYQDGRPATGHSTAGTTTNGSSAGSGSGSGSGTTTTPTGPGTAGQQQQQQQHQTQQAPSTYPDGTLALSPVGLWGAGSGVRGKAEL